jgi:hypothetical protein
MAQRLTPLAGTAALLLMAPLVALSAPAHATGQVPVCQPDAVTVTIDSREAHLNLSANDFDAEGDPLSYAGTDRNIPGVGIIDNTKTGGPQDLVVFASTFPRPGDTSAVVPGTYEVKTFMSDGSNLAASTLTITVLPSPGDAVQLTRKKRPGRVLVHNDNDVAISFLWGAEKHKRADGRVTVPPHASRAIRIERRSLVTVVLAGTEYALGIRRHLRPPRDGSELPPGFEQGHSIFEAWDTHWVKKAIKL